MLQLPIAYMCAYLIMVRTCGFTFSVYVLVYRKNRFFLRIFIICLINQKLENLLGDIDSGHPI